MLKFVTLDFLRKFNGTNSKYVFGQFKLLMFKVTTHQTIQNNLKKQAIVNTFNSRLTAENDETEEIKPIPSPGVVRRGSIEGKIPLFFS